MILTKNEILKEIKKGNIKIKPFNLKNIGPASIDLTLSDRFRLFRGNKKIILNEKTDYKKLTKGKKLKELVLKPGDFALGITKETIKLPDNLCGWLGGRSRFARLGLIVHITASFVQPGINNKQVLEIKNVSNNTLILKPGERLCQLIIEKAEGKAKYKGKFKKQEL
ncbi:dCTP deaminase [Candidatus Woesearchaeota archaeon]|nr:dCTP deaminase [Candidatus Woesearchaeota archaeon]